MTSEQRQKTVNGWLIIRAAYRTAMAPYSSELSEGRVMQAEDIARTGLCGAIGKALDAEMITLEEYACLHSDLVDNCPVEGEGGDGYWWAKGMKEPRVLWMTRRIDALTAPEPQPQA